MATDTPAPSLPPSAAIIEPTRWHAVGPLEFDCGFSDGMSQSRKYLDHITHYRGAYDHINFDYDYDNDYDLIQGKAMPVNPLNIYIYIYIIIIIIVIAVVDLKRV